MKPTLPILLCCFALPLAARCPAQDPARPNLPPGSAQRSADSTRRDPALADVFTDLGRLLNKQVITDATVSVNQTVTLPDLDGIAPPQRVNLIERSLFLNGYTLVDADKDTVVVLGPGKNPRSVGVPLYTRSEDLPAGERVVSYLFKLQRADPIEVASVLQQFIPPGNDVNFTAFEKSHFVIATAPTSVMRIVTGVVAEIDAVAPEGKKPKADGERAAEKPAF